VAGAAAQAGSRPEVVPPLDAGLLVAALEATMLLVPLPEQPAVTRIATAAKADPSTPR